MVVLTETWLTDENVHNDSPFQFPNFYPNHEVKKRSCNGDGVAVFIQNTLNDKIR